MSGSNKLINTDNLILASAASAKKFGSIRSLSLDKKKYTLDPEGIHIIGMTFMQEFSVRCQVLCKTVERGDLPVVAWLDMEYDVYNRLMTYDEAMALAAKEGA